jgi:hypothetical protein
MQKPWASKSIDNLFFPPTQIGIGAYGIVSKATRKEDNKTYAIKETKFPFI